MPPMIRSPRRLGAAIGPSILKVRVLCLLKTTAPALPNNLARIWRRRQRPGGCLTTSSAHPRGEMKAAGPLPTGTLLKTPKQPLADARSTKRQQINAGFDAAMSASLTMPSTSATPSTYEVATALTDDPDGYAALLTIHTARRDTLLAAMEAATSHDAVQAIAFSYAV